MKRSDLMTHQWIQSNLLVFASIDPSMCTSPPMTFGRSWHPLSSRSVANEHEAQSWWLKEIEEGLLRGEEDEPLMPMGWERVRGSVRQDRLWRFWSVKAVSSQPVARLYSKSAVVLRGFFFFFFKMSKHSRQRTLNTVIWCQFLPSRQKKARVFTVLKKGSVVMTTAFLLVVILCFEHNSNMWYSSIT